MSAKTYQITSEIVRINTTRLKDTNTKERLTGEFNKDLVNIKEEILQNTEIQIKWLLL